MAWNDENRVSAVEALRENQAAHDAQVHDIIEYYFSMIGFTLAEVAEVLIRRDVAPPRKSWSMMAVSRIAKRHGMIARRKAYAHRQHFAELREKWSGRDKP